MEEIIEQYNNAKKWKREMLIAMIAMLTLAVGMIVCGLFINDLIVLFMISGGIIAAFGVVLFIISNSTFKKVDKLIREYLAANGKSSEEINSILGGSAK